MQNLKDRVTIYEVAKHAGVSLATVSRVINNQGNVTEKTREKVQETIKKLNYKPSGLAQALATNKSTTIGVVIPSANYVYISNFLNGVCDIAKEKGFNISLFSTSHSKEDALRMLEKVITSHVDGVIIFDDELDEEDVERLSSFYVPTIVVNNNVSGERVGCITFGYEHKLKALIEEKFGKTTKKTPVFLHVLNCGRLLTRTEKRFIDVVKSLNKEYKILNSDDSYSRTYSEFMEYFKDPANKNEYFIAYRDSIAAAILNAATDSGLNVPEDVEVLSLIGTKYAGIIRPSISSMHIDLSDVGRRSMFMLIDLMNNQLEKKSCRIEAVYEKRSSTKE